MAWFAGFSSLALLVVSILAVNRIRKQGIEIGKLKSEIKELRTSYWNLKDENNVLLSMDPTLDELDRVSKRASERKDS